MDKDNNRSLTCVCDVGCSPQTLNSKSFVHSNVRGLVQYGKETKQTKKSSIFTLSTQSYKTANSVVLKCLSCSLHFGAQFLV